MAIANKTLPKADEIHQLIVGTMLLAAAGKASRALDTFGTWLLAGFGAAVALLLTNHDTLALIPSAASRGEIRLFLFAVVLAVIQKYVAIIVTMADEGSTLGREIVTPHLGRGAQIDPDMITSEVLRGLYGPQRWIVRKMFAKSKGDFAAAPRAFMKMAQVQGLLVVLEVALFLIAIWRIGQSLPG
jgi:hypothetical protein